MKRLLIPDARFDDVRDIKPELLERLGIKFLFTDLDNTLVPYDPQELNEGLVRWKSSLEAHGIRLMIVSNNKTYRVERFAKLLGVDWVMHAKKPLGGGIDEAMRRVGAIAGESAAVGDQLRTDILGGHIRGMRAFYVKPVANDNLLRRFRYLIARPIVLLCRERY